MATPPRLARLRLARVQTLALTAMVPVVGALVFMGLASPGEPLAGRADLLPLVLLFITGGLFHVFGFVLNEWADLEVDRASSDLTHKPLVAGSVSSREAMAIAVGAAAFAFVPLLLVTRDPVAHVTLALAMVAGAVYDLYGKMAPLDVVLAGSLTLLLLSGVIASGEFDPASQRHLVVLACLVGLQFLQNLFQNAIEGGMKDADHDAAAGARTFAAVMGVNVADGNILSGRGFLASGIAIKATSLTIAGFLVAYLWAVGGRWLLAIAVVLVGLQATVMLITLARFMGRRVRFDREALKRSFSVHEMATFGVTMAALLPVIGVPSFLLVLVVPVLWFLSTNALLFGRALEPGV